ncbi:MAG TPA: hypothetical protein VFD53_07110, partial [Ilumatobacter sp.]|nr:hypothetical protein [Ilumatobacter sp.]
SENNPVCEAPEDYCTITNDGVLTLCLPTCDPLIQDCDDAGDTCVPVNEFFACVPDGSGNQGAFNDPCDQINECDPGNVCILAELLPDCGNPVACCSTFCSLADPDPCAALDPELVCLPWYVEGQAPPGLENVGVCALP